MGKRRAEPATVSSDNDDRNNEPANFTDRIVFPSFFLSPTFLCRTRRRFISMGLLVWRISAVGGGLIGIIHGNSLSTLGERVIRLYGKIFESLFCDLALKRQRRNF